MTDINSATQTDALSAYRAQSTNNSKPENELGQDAFLELLVAQLNNQNPLDPQDNGDFIAELAQFSSVEGIESLNSSVDSFFSDFRSSQALQASALVGRQVVVPNNEAYWSGEGSVPATVDVPNGANNVTFNITDQAGQLVAQIPMTDALPGENSILWDGKDAEGNTLPAGKYKFSANGFVNDSSESFVVYGSARVNSVTLQDGNTLLNVAGIGQISLSEVREISE